MKVLADADIIRIMREEWKKKKDNLTSIVEVAMTAKIDGEEKTVVSPDLKVTKQGLEYKVVSVSPDTVVLDPVVSSDEDSSFSISTEEFEKEYEGPGEK